MTKNKNQKMNKTQNKPVSNNKGNSMGMNTLQTTRTDKNPNPSE